MVHLAARLAERARNGQILISQRVQLATEQLVDSVALGEQEVSGLSRPVQVFGVERLRTTMVAMPPVSVELPAGLGPLTEREQQVVALIVRGCSNREIAEELVIAEGTAVRHVATS